ncbi:MAG: argininosuccinate synthase [Eubacteriaceae bacterium]|nr:argininosuccinate synthase [Eubacteriaceae bacterium]
MKTKIVLAYSGGLDTSTIVPWLKENYDCEVHCVCVDVGQIKPGESEQIISRAKAIGADSVQIADATKELLEEYIWPMLKSGAVYEDKYLLGTSIARPVIAKKLVDRAKEIGADYIAHGATGKGNDQVRFELTIMALAPEMKIIAPWRIWDIKSREDAYAYCTAHGITLNVSLDKSYSMDENIWHLSHEGLDLEDPANPPQYDKILELSGNPLNAPDEPECLTLEFEKGIPVKLNGVEMGCVELVQALNALGGKHGIGIEDMVENRVVGMKSRGIYETPGGTILFFAHKQLEELCLDRELSGFKRIAALKYADLVYEGKWFSSLREALDKFVDQTQQKVTGEVKLKLYKGNIIPNGTVSKYSLYNQNIASFAMGDIFDPKDAEGFIKLYGLPLKVKAMAEINNGGK